MTHVSHYQAAEQMIDGRRISEIEVGRAQVHATLALVEILRDISAELSMIRETAQLISASTPPPGR
jgi:hypothetical protein